MAFSFSSMVPVIFTNQFGVNGGPEVAGIHSVLEGTSKNSKVFTGRPGFGLHAVNTHS